MDVIYVKKTIKPLALVSNRLFHAPVPHSGRAVEMSLHNRVDDSGAMHWVRTFFKNPSFPEDVTFTSHIVCSGDHKIIEFTRYGLGVESDLSVDGEGSLVYVIRRYVERLPFLRLTLRFPTWLSPFGGGRTKEIGETEDSFRGRVRDDSLNLRTDGRLHRQVWVRIGLMIAGPGRRGNNLPARPSPYRGDRPSVLRGMLAFTRSS